MPTPYFNPRTPCGVRLIRPQRCRSRWTFQSTHPLRGATLNSASKGAILQFQSTHPLRGATAFISPLLAFFIISIHAPLAGCDQSLRRLRPQARNFNPRTPCGVRPVPYMETPPPLNFNPRTPCGVRQALRTDKILTLRFQSTHPLRGATESIFMAVPGSFISIHAPLAGCD